MKFRWDVFKFPPSWPALLLVIAGAAFLALDILDIHEDYHLSWSIPVINTIFISGSALFIALLAAQRYRKTGSRLILGAGCAVVLFGAATALKSWLDLDLMVRIALRDYPVVLVAVIHLVSVTSGQGKTVPAPDMCGKWALPAGGYVVMIGVAILITWLVYAGWLPELGSGWGDGVISRMAVQGAAGVIAVIAGLITLYVYRTQPGTWYIWYALGLLLFGFGEWYIALGQLTGKLAWTGRTMQYLSGIYIFMMLLRFRPVSLTEEGNRLPGAMEQDPG